MKNTKTLVIHVEVETNNNQEAQEIGETIAIKTGGRLENIFNTNDLPF